MSPRLKIIRNVLEGAKDAGDDAVVSACRRLVRAHLLGWKKHHNPADWKLVKAFAE